MMKKIVLLLVSTFMVLTSNSQYFSKSYPYTDVKGSFINKCTYINKNILKHELVICPNNAGCSRISLCDSNDEELWAKEKPYFNGNNRTLTYRNDTIFYSGRNNTYPDSIYYWYFGMMTSDGDSIAEYKYAMQNIVFGSITNYGLTLVGKDEVILWGEGIDNRMPNPTKVPYRSAFLRLGLDGQVRTPLLWWELGDRRDRRMTDCVTDIDGNLAFSYYYADEVSLSNYIITLDAADKFKTVGNAEIKGGEELFGFPRIAIDGQGNYFTQVAGYASIPLYNTEMIIPYISKLDREGNVLWNEHIAILRREPDKLLWLTSMQVNRLSTTTDGDVLVAGDCSVADSFYIRVLGVTERLRANIGFIARYASDGKLRWRHLLAPQMRNGIVHRNSILDINEGADGTILVGGRLLRDEAPYRTEDSWLMRLSAEGYLNDACDHIDRYWHWPDTIVATVDVALQPLSIYPNPGTTACTIAIGDDVTLPLNYELIYSDGRRVEMGIHSTRSPLHLATDAYPSGMYLLRIRDARGQIGQGKWVKVR